MKRLTHPRILSLLLIALALLAGCERVLTSPHGAEAGVALAFQASVASAPEVATIVVEVRGPGIAVPILANFTVVDGVAAGTLQVPAGKDRVFTARGFDSEGAITHEGSVVRDVRLNGPPVQIPLTPRGIGVEIVVTVSGYLIAIVPAGSEPPAGVYAVGAGESLLFRAQVTSPTGDPLPIDAADLAWASSNPAILRVDAEGANQAAATGLYSGIAYVSVNYRGIAAQARVAVDGTLDGEVVLMRMVRLDDSTVADDEVRVRMTLTNLSDAPTSDLRFGLFATKAEHLAWIDYETRGPDWNSRDRWQDNCTAFSGWDGRILVCSFVPLAPGENVTYSFTFRFHNTCAPDVEVVATLHRYHMAPENVMLETTTPTPLPCPTQIASADRLVFSSNRAGQFDLYTVRPDGSDVLRLTNNVAAESDPAWSPDRSRIAFVRNGALHIMNANGSGETALGGTTYHSPTWSPDGARIAVGQKQGDDLSIAIIDAATGASTPASESFGQGDELHLDWSPDGQRMAVSPQSQSGLSGKIILLNLADGTQHTMCIAYASDCFLLSGRLAWPRWSPDGSKLVYGHDYGLQVVRLDGSRATVLTTVLSGSRPSWSPDGEYIALEIYGYLNSFPDSHADVMAVRADGTGRRFYITNTAQFDFMPGW